MRRTSIRTLMALVVLAAVGLAALKNASELWAGIMLLLGLAAEGAAILGVSLMPGRERAWWLGFAVFAGLYLALAIGPWVSDGFRRQLITSHWLVQLRDTMSGTNLPALTVEMQAIQAELVKLRSTPPKSQSDPVVSSLRKNLRAIQSQLTASKNAGLRYDDFQRTGHALFAILAGLVGGTVGLWFWARRERAEASSAD